MCFKLKKIKIYCVFLQYLTNNSVIGYKTKNGLSRKVLPLVVSR